MSKKKGVFNEAITELTRRVEDPPCLGQCQMCAELRATIEVLRSLEKLDIGWDEGLDEWHIDGATNTGRGDFCRAILSARKVAARRKP
jgi:hypothetical protein